MNFRGIVGSEVYRNECINSNDKQWFICKYRQRGND